MNPTFKGGTKQGVRRRGALSLLVTRSRGCFGFPAYDFGFGVTRILLGVLAFVMFACSQTSLAAVASTEATPPAPSARPITLSPGIAEILKLVQAKVEPRVIKAFIQTSPVAYHPSAQELIVLKKLGVPEDILVALMNRGTQLKGTPPRSATAREQQPPPKATAPYYSSGAPPYGSMLSQSAPYASLYSGYGYSPYSSQAALPYGSVTSVNSSVPLYGASGRPVYSGFYLNPDPAAYGLYGTFNNSYRTYVNGGPVYSAFYVPGYGYLW